MKKDHKKSLLIKERQEAIKEILKALKTIDIGNDIRLVLEASGFTKQELADLIDRDRSDIANICKRKNSINLVQVILMSVALDHNFLDKVMDLLKPEQESILPERYTFEVTSSSIQIIRRTDKVSVKTFRLQEE